MPHTADPCKLLLDANCMHAPIIDIGGFANLLFGVKTVVDLGASDGRWTREHLTCFHESARFVLFEPLEYPDPFQHPKVSWHRAVASDRNGTARFTVTPDKFGSGVYKDTPDAVEVPSMRLDSVLTEQEGPFFVKFDTHGHERPILHGLGAVLLAQTEFVLMECYNIPESLGGCAFSWLDVASVLPDFRALAITECMHRPGDGVLWQLDILFARKTNSVFQQTSYAV